MWTKTLLWPDCAQESTRTRRLVRADKAQSISAHSTGLISMKKRGNADLPDRDFMFEPACFDVEICSDVNRRSAHPVSDGFSCLLWGPKIDLGDSTILGLGGGAGTG